ncbi:hypothetical protein ACFYQ5_29795 [Streptomyces sp. NPDC005794]|uniref:hypothetical protein n=1 Tax=Streptomyces sp. NPDC005794 TaxID=3364733 RepID=UPI0036A04B66
MSKPRPIRTYRLRPEQRVVITLTLGMPGVAPVAGAVMEDDAPLVFRIGLLLLAGAGFLIIAGFWRMATIVRHDTIVVRQLLRTRMTAWSDVLALDIEAGPTLGRGLLLDREGRRFALTGGVGTHVHEVREMWLRSRGEGWTPLDPGFVTAAERRMQARSSALGWAVTGAAGSLVVLLVFGYTLSLGRRGRLSLDASAGRHRAGGHVRRRVPGPAAGPTLGGGR